jgi:hypothetical protein
VCLGWAGAGHVSAVPEPCSIWLWAGCRTVDVQAMAARCPDAGSDQTQLLTDSIVSARVRAAGGRLSNWCALSVSRWAGAVTMVAGLGGAGGAQASCTTYS